MNAGNRGGKRVRGVVRLRNCGKPEEEANRFLHLCLVGPGDADDGLLDAVRRIFGKRYAFEGQRERDDAPGFCDAHGARDVFRKIEGFHARKIRRIEFEHCIEFGEYLEQPVLVSRFRTGFYNAVGEIHEPVRHRMDNAPPGRSKAGIDPDDALVFLLSHENAIVAGIGTKKNPESGIVAAVRDSFVEACRSSQFR